MEGDVFINTAKNNPKPDSYEDEDNFFLHQNSEKKKNLNASEPIRHLNSYDYDIMRESAYQEVSDEVLKYEYKISKLEDDIKNIDSQIKAAKEINDFFLADDLCSRKLKMELELKKLMEMYREASLSAKISGGVATKIKEGFINVKKCMLSVAESLISKIPGGKFSSFVEVRASLEKLADINKSVDELMADKYSLWESDDKYNRLSKYISKANTIQTEISRLLK